MDGKALHLSALAEVVRLSIHGRPGPCQRRPEVQRSRWASITGNGSAPGPSTCSWNARTSTAAERFRYEYSTRQLRAWVPKLQQLASEAKSVHALMNNCYRDFGVHNAAQLRDMLEELE